MKKVIIFSILGLFGATFSSSAATITVWGRNMGTTVTQTATTTVYFIECDNWFRDEKCYTIEGVTPASPQKMSVYQKGNIVLQDEGSISSKAVMEKGSVSSFAVEVSKH